MPARLRRFLTRHPLVRDALLWAVPAILFAAALRTLVLAYLTVHGFTTAAIASYTRAVGHVFTPAVVLIFALKTFFFSLAVALFPIATVAYEPRASATHLQRVHADAWAGGRQQSARFHRRPHRSAAA